MDIKKDEETSSSTTEHKVDVNKQNKEEKVEVKKSEDEKKIDFKCSACFLNEKCDYFGMNPPFVLKFTFKEPSYIMKDPFLPPKGSEFIILGAHCIKCSKPVCRDNSCSFYFDGTYCISCAKQNATSFPSALQEKLNRVVVK